MANSPNYLDPATLRAALTGLHEKTVVIDGLGAVLIRELSAAQREAARAAAYADNPEQPDESLYRAILVQLCVVDPESGVAGSDGRVDPRTRRPLFTADDLAVLADGRAALIDYLVSEITSLSALLPTHLKSGGDRPDGQ